MNCRSAIRRVPAYLNKELSADVEAALSEHLSSCRSCQAEMAVLKQTMAAMDAHKDIKPEFTLADVKSRARERNARRGWFLPAPRWATALGAAAAVFVGAVGGIGLHAVSQPTQPPVASRAVSDILSLGASDDPIANLIAESPSGFSSTPVGSEREDKL